MFSVHVSGQGSLLEIPQMLFREQAVKDLPRSMRKLRFCPPRVALPIPHFFHHGSLCGRLFGCWQGLGLAESQKSLCGPKACHVCAEF